MIVCKKILHLMLIVQNNPASKQEILLLSSGDLNYHHSVYWMRAPLGQGGGGGGIY